MDSGKAVSVRATASETVKVIKAAMATTTRAATATQMETRAATRAIAGQR